MNLSYKKGGEKMKFLSLLGAAADASGDVGGNGTKGISYAGGGGYL